MKNCQNKFSYEHEFISLLTRGLFIELHITDVSCDKIVILCYNVNKNQLNVSLWFIYLILYNQYK
jgi:hypothetical protein